MAKKPKEAPKDPLTEWYDLVRAVFLSPEGMKFLSLMESSFEESKVGPSGPIDPYRLAYEKGQRDVVRSIRSAVGQAIQFQEHLAGGKPLPTQAVLNTEDEN